ncbi:MAG: ABC transporter permease [bacterium]|nr:ABC transporter permease [bacterium]MCY4271777.1 ABC transporter permease [bacterium]
MPADTVPAPDAGYVAGMVVDPLSHAHRLMRVAVGLIGGVAAIAAGLMMLTDVHAGYRVVLTVGGLVLLYFALDSGGKIVWGPLFETGLWLSVAWVAIVGLSAAFADFLPFAEARDASATIFGDTPTLKRPDLLSANPLGTDRQALDVLGGIVYGARVSLQVSVLAVAIGIIAGGTIGVVAGFFRGKLDTGVGVIVDSLLAFPPLILLLALASVMDRSPRNMAIALAVLGIPTYIRLARVSTMVFAEREFVLASRAMGASRRRIIFRELVPNVALPIFSYAFIIIAVLIVAEASLSFLGLGIQRPDPTWGNMIAAGQDDFDRHPHLVFAPGIVMFLTVFALNRVGEKARELWDPRQAKL